MSKPDPQTAILLHLMRSKPKKARTVKAIAVAIERAESTVRNNLAVMTEGRPWPYSVPWVRVEESKGQAAVYGLTDAGREAARWRARSHR